MKWYKVQALIYREGRIFRNAKYRAVLFLYFPITTIIIWGLFSSSVQGRALETGMLVLIVNVFWNFGQLAQSSTNMAMMDDSFSGSLKHIFVSGVSSTEYILARIITSSLLSAVVVVLLIGLSVYAFQATILLANFSLVVILTCLTLIASIGLSVFVAGMILALGKEYGFLSWSSIQIFVLLSAPFYSISVFPEIIQPVAWVMPFTNIFEGIRQLISAGFVDPTLIVNGAIISVAYLAVSFPFYTAVFRHAKKNGNLVKMGS